MSSITLPSDTSEQWEILLLLLSSEEMKIDRTCDMEVDVMKYFISSEGIRKILLQWLNQMQNSYAKKKTDLDAAVKSDEISLKWRQKGNEQFRSNSITESYHCYTKSLMYSEHKSESFPLALSNRSAALFRLRKYKKCLSDIELALSNGYPEDKQLKLYLRQADCFVELGMKSKAEETLIKINTLIENIKTKSSQVSECVQHVEVLKKKLLTLVEGNKKDDKVKLPELKNGENENFVSASNSVQLSNSPSAGRHVTTTESTNHGDILFSEEPYAFVALPIHDDMAIVCEQCCSHNLNPIPCRTCSRAIYCSDACRGAAWDAHHQFECSGAQFRLFPTIGIAHLALRVLLTTCSNGFPPLKPEFLDDVTPANVFKCYSSYDNIEIYHKDMPSFYRMFNLVTNFDKMNNADFTQYALTATMLTIYLENFSTFFSYLPSKLPFVLSVDDMRIFASAIILRSLGQLVCNGHAALSLSSLRDSDQNKIVSEREIRHATAIYPSAAMMNHSCDPNIINSFYRNRLIIRCAQEMPQGSEVFNCYGPHRARESTENRRLQLKSQYMFNCDCTACSDKDRKDFILFSAYACQSCKGPVIMSAGKPICQQCQRKDFNTMRVATQLQKAKDFMLQAERAQSAEERCEKTQASFRLKQQVWHRHNTQLREAADLLAKEYAEIGEHTKSIDLIKQNVQTLELQYGSFSVEVAHELRKLSDVMIERIINLPQHPDYKDWCKETHKIVQKALKLMELNYGSWEPLVHRLTKKEKMVTSLLEDCKRVGERHHHNAQFQFRI